MRRRCLARRAESGETLIELIVSITILGIVAVAIGSGITVSVIISDEHRKETAANAYLHDYAEALQASYANCTAGTPNYLSPLKVSPVPTGFTTGGLTESLAYWNGTAFQSTCPVGGDGGLQQVTLKLSSTDNRASESLVVVVRSTT